MNAVGFGVVGLGMGRSRARLVTQTDGAKLAGVCDIDPERLHAVTEELHCKGYSDYQEMLADDEVEVVYVMTPSGTHLDFGQQAAAAGKHVVTTKPMEVTVDRCRRLMAACSARDVELIVDFEMRYDPALQQWKAAIEAGELGELVFAEARCKWWRSQAYYDQGGWRGTWKMDGGGSLANQGIHVVDLLVWLCGDPKVVAARSGAFAHRIETEDLTTALLEMPNGNPAVITTTTNHHLDDEFGVAISGTSGSVSNLTRQGLRVKFEQKEQAHLQTAVPDWPRSAAEDMVGVLARGQQPHVPGEQGIRAIHLLESIYTTAGVR